MITIKLPYTASDKFQKKLKELRRQYSNVVRYSYNRYNQDKLGQTEINELVKHSLNNCQDISSYLRLCAISEGKAISDQNKDSKVIFGGKFNFIQRLKGKISKEEFKNTRLLPLNIQADKLKYGNRHFNLNIIDENFIEFKLSRTEHFILYLPKLAKNYKRDLYKLETLAKLNQIGYSVRLTEEFIYISFEEQVLNSSENLPKLNGKRYVGIDLNPENIGISIFESEKLLDTIHFDLSKITQKILNSNFSSDSKESKHLNNKLKFETLQISKKIESLTKHYSCKFVFVEDLKFKQTKQIRGVDKWNKTSNRLTKNLWKREIFLNNLKKRINLIGGKVFEINPAYTSVIGNLQHDFSDPVNASIEIARRGFNVIILKNKQFYPTFRLKDSILDLWKESKIEMFDNWRGLFGLIKNSKLKYRVSLNEVMLQTSVFSLNNCKRSDIKMYNFDKRLCLLC